MLDGEVSAGAKDDALQRHAHDLGDRRYPSGAGGRLRLQSQPVAVDAVPASDEGGQHAHRLDDVGIAYRHVGLHLAAA
jgi:hypothetical protein